MLARLAADAILLLHLGFLLFAVFGAALALRWRWLIMAHLPAVAWGTLVELADQPGHACSDVDRLVQTHLVEVRQRITDLQRLEAELQRLAGCNQSSVKDCRIIEALSAAVQQAGPTVDDRRTTS